MGNTTRTMSKESASSHEKLEKDENCIACQALHFSSITEDLASRRGALRDKPDIVHDQEGSWMPYKPPEHFAVGK